MKKQDIKNILRILLLGLFLILFKSNIAAQREDTTVVVQQNDDTTAVVQQGDDEGKLPVRNPWATGMLIDNQTTECPNAGSIEIAIHHRFGLIKNMSDIFGIYAASNIRIGVTYGITEDIAVGFGSEKNNKMQEFTGKYKIISQSRNGKIPVSVTYFGNIVIDAREKEIFGANYEFINRLSFFNQVLVSRKVTNDFSAEFGASFSHFNSVTDLVQDSSGRTIGKWKNDYIGLMVSGRYKFHNNMSAMVEYSHPLAINSAWQGQSEPKPGLSFGLEIGTSTHAFQIFVANYDGIVAQQNYAHNLNDMSHGKWHLGFNITVRL
jgi:hypothetical protein